MGSWMLFYVLLSIFSAYWCYELASEFIGELVGQYYSDLKIDEEEREEMIQKRQNRIS